MRGENQLQRGLAGFNDGRTIRPDFRAFTVKRINAGSNQAAGALDFDDADAAGADRVDIFQVAEGRDIDADRVGSFQNCGTLGNRIIPAVDFYIDVIHCSAPPYFLMIAPNLHFSMQAPHLMHLDLSMTCGCLTVPLIALTGHCLAHAVQPLHLSARIS